MRAKLLLVLLILVFLNTACSGDVRTVEMKPMVVDTPTPENCDLTEPQSDNERNRWYFDGAIPVAQYYTFLGHGLYSEAYDLLGSEKQKIRSREDYIKYSSTAFKRVELISVYPIALLGSSQGLVTRNGIFELQYEVHLKAWGEGEMSGSIPSGMEQTLFIVLINENCAWRIDSFNTAVKP